jgi:hypothetical protein
MAMKRTVNPKQMRIICGAMGRGVMRGERAGKREIRNPKLEIRKKSETRNELGDKIFEFGPRYLQGFVNFATFGFLISF